VRFPVLLALQYVRNLVLQQIWRTYCSLKTVFGCHRNHGWVDKKNEKCIVDT
jgi:hypothetical protein